MAIIEYSVLGNDMDIHTVIITNYYSDSSIILFAPGWKVSPVVRPVTQRLPIALIFDAISAPFPIPAPQFSSRAISTQLSRG